MLMKTEPYMLQMVNRVIWECLEAPTRWADGRTTNAEWAQQLIDWDILGYVKMYDC